MSSRHPYRATDMPSSSIPAPEQPSSRPESFAMRRRRGEICFFQEPLQTSPPNTNPLERPPPSTAPPTPPKSPPTLTIIEDQSLPVLTRVRPVRRTPRPRPHSAHRHGRYRRAVLPRHLLLRPPQTDLPRPKPYVPRSIYVPVDFPDRAAPRRSELREAL